MKLNYTRIGLLLFIVVSFAMFQNCGQSFLTSSSVAPSSSVESSQSEFGASLEADRIQQVVVDEAWAAVVKNLSQNEAAVKDSSSNSSEAIRNIDTVVSSSQSNNLPLFLTRKNVNYECLVGDEKLDLSNEATIIRSLTKRVYTPTDKDLDGQIDGLLNLDETKLQSLADVDAAISMIKKRYRDMRSQLSYIFEDEGATADTSNTSSSVYRLAKRAKLFRGIYQSTLRSATLKVNKYINCGSVYSDLKLDLYNSLFDVGGNAHWNAKYRSGMNLLDYYGASKIDHLTLMMEEDMDWLSIADRDRMKMRREGRIAGRSGYLIYAVESSGSNQPPASLALNLTERLQVARIHATFADNSYNVGTSHSNLYLDIPGVVTSVQPRLLLSVHSSDVVPNAVINYSDDFAWVSRYLDSKSADTLEKTRASLRETYLHFLEREMAVASQSIVETLLSMRVKSVDDPIRELLLLTDYIQYRTGRERDFYVANNQGQIDGIVASRLQENYDLIKSMNATITDAKPDLDYQLRSIASISDPILAASVKDNINATNAELISNIKQRLKNFRRTK